MSADKNIEVQTRSEFEKLYEFWENFLKRNYSDYSMFESNEDFYHKNQKTLKELRISMDHLTSLLNIRNVNAHTPSFLTINQEAVTRLRILVNNFCRKAADIATPRDKIYSVGLTAVVEEVASKMVRLTYTHVPVIHQGNFVGVFSENTILRLFAEERDGNGLKIGDIQKLLQPQKGADRYTFIEENASYVDVRHLFQSYIDRGERLGVVFLTPKGQKSGDIQGLITAWDLHKGIKELK